MSVADKLNTLQTIKANIKTAIENKGITVGDAAFTDYANKISSIEVGAVVTLTQSQYDALTDKDNNTIYLIKG